MEIKLTGTKIMIVNTSFNWLAYVWSVFQAFFFLCLIIVVPMALPLLSTICLIASFLLNVLHSCLIMFFSVIHLYIYIYLTPLCTIPGNITSHHSPFLANFLIPSLSCAQTHLFCINCSNTFSRRYQSCISPLISISKANIHWKELRFKASQH